MFMDNMCLGMLKSISRMKVAVLFARADGTSLPTEKSLLTINRYLTITYYLSSYPYSLVNETPMEVSVLYVDTYYSRATSLNIQLH